MKNKLLHICANTPPMGFKRTSLLLPLLFAFAFMLGVGNAWGVDATMAAGTNGSSATLNGTISAIKCGVSKNGGSMTVTIPAGATGLGLYVAGWSGDNPSVSVSRSNSGTISKSSISPTCDTGISGSGSSFTLANNVSTYVDTFSMGNKNAETTVTFSTSAGKKRFVVWGAKVCFSPTSLTNGTITSSSAHLSWSYTNNTDKYEVYYSTNSTAPTASTAATINSSTIGTTKSVDVSGLSGGTTYYWWIRAVDDYCKSPWVAGSSFTTTAAAFTITAQSNNSDYGTVSGTSVITASPNEGYRIDNDDPYSVTSGTATVVRGTGANINKFTVTPSSDCTVQINFEEIPSHDIIFHTGDLVNIASVSVKEGVEYTVSQTPAESLTSSCEYGTFVGWTTSSSIANASVQPTLITDSKVTMSTTDIDLYAIYSKTVGATGAAAGTTMFSEAWTGVSASQQPTSPTSNGSSVYGGATISYDWYSNGSTSQTYTSDGPNGNENILVSKNNGYWKVSGIPTGGATTLTVSYEKSGSGSITLSTSTSNVSVSGSTVTITKPNDVSSFDLSFTNTLSSNCRIDDISVVVATTSSSGTTTYSLNPNCRTPLGSINGEVSMSQKSATLTWDLTNAQNGGKDNINSWKVEYKADGDADWTVAEANLAKATLTKAISNLNCNTDYQFRVSANVASDYTCEFFETSNKTTKFAITTNTASEGGWQALTVKIGEDDVTEACDGATILVAATADGNHEGDATIVILKTEDNSEVTTAVGYSAGSFTMPAYAVKVCVTFDEKQSASVTIKNVGGAAITELDFGSEAGSEVKQGSDPVSQDLKISGIQLESGSLTLSLPQNSHFTLSESSINVGGTLEETTITVTPNTSNPGQFNETLTISGGGLASPVEITLKITVLETFTVNWYVNGGVDPVHSQTDVADTDYDEVPSDFSAATDCSDLYFVGWSESPIAAEGTTSAPILATIGTKITTNKDYYAVFAEGTPGATTKLLDENFASCTGTGANGDNAAWSGSIASTDLPTTGSLASWTFENSAAANACVKCGTGKAGGSAQTPGIAMTGSATLTFKAGAWNGNTEGTTLSVSADGATLKKNNETVTSVDMTKGAWENYSLTITDLTKETITITFSTAAGNCRFFLDDVVVSQTSNPNFTAWYTTCPHCTSVSLSTSEPSNGNSITLTPASTVKTCSAAEVMVNATLADGWQLDGIELSGTASAKANYNSTTGKIELEAGAEGALLATATFAQANYTVTLNQNPAVGATLTGATDEAHYGETINLSTTVPDNALFVNWTSDDVTITNPTSATEASFTMPGSNVTVTANFIEVHNVAWAIDNTPASDKSDFVYVKGIVTSITDINTTQYYNATYSISDLDANGEPVNSYLVFRAKNEGNTNYTAADQLKIGDNVTVYGKLTIYEGVKEFAQGGYIATNGRTAATFDVVVSGTASKTDYYANETFAFAGLKAKAEYSTGYKKEVTNDATWKANNATSFTITEAGTVNVTATWNETTSDNFPVTVTVTTKELESITLSETALTGYLGQALPKPTTVTAHFDDQGEKSTENVTAFAQYSDNYDPTSTAAQTITVSYHFGPAAVPAQTADYTVTLSSIVNDLASAYTVADARAIIDLDNQDGNNLALDESTNKVIVTGRITAISGTTYTIKDNANDDEFIEIYEGSLGSYSSVEVGELIKVEGNLLYYENNSHTVFKYQIVNGVIVWKQPKVAITIANQTLEVGQNWTIQATTEPNGATMSYSIKDDQVSSTYVSLNTTTNEITALAEGTATIVAYADAYNEYLANDKEFTVTVIPVQIHGPITYVENGANEDLDNDDDAIALPDPLPTVTKDGCVFGGWFTDAEFTTLAVAGSSMPSTAGFTLYAKWIEVPSFNNDEYEWQRVTSDAQLVAGKFYVIASDAQGKVMSNTISSDVAGEVTAAFTNGVIAYNGFASNQNVEDADVAVLHLDGTSSAYRLTEVTDQKALLGATAVKKLAWGNGTTTWTISISSNNATIQNGTSSYGRFLHNVNSTRFTTYTSDPTTSMLLPQLYVWTKIPYKLTFDANGGTNAPAVQSANEQGEVTITSSVPTPPEGFVFNGWKDASNHFYYAGQTITLTADMTLTAQWRDANLTLISKLAGKFIINQYGDTAIFSRGNLQYQQSTGTWRAAENQYEWSGVDANVQMGNPNYAGWVDLFSWSLGAENNYGATSSYLSTAYHNKNFVDWGKLFDTGDYWSTFSHDEWDYLLNKRSDANDKWGMALIGDTLGMILLPEKWTAPAGITFVPRTNPTSELWDEGDYLVPDDQDHCRVKPENMPANKFTLEQWAQLEAAGAVFLPYAGRRSGGYGNYTNRLDETVANEYAYAYYENYLGTYWTSTLHNAELGQADYVYTFKHQIINGEDDYQWGKAVIWSENGRYGQSVRLAHIIPRKYTVTYDANGATSGTVPVDEVTYVAGAEFTVLSEGDLAKEGFVFGGWKLGDDIYSAGQTVETPKSKDDVVFVAQWLQMVETDYVLVTNTAQLSNNDKVCIVAAASNNAMGTQNTGSYRNCVIVSKNEAGDRLLVPEGQAVSATELTLGKSGDNYTLKDGNQYLYSTSAKSIGVREAEFTWTISVTSAGVATIDAGSAGKLQYNASSPRFAAYTTNQQPVSIFKKLQPVVITEDEDASSILNYSDVTVTDGTVLTVDTDKPLNNLVVEQGGKVIVESGQKLEPRVIHVKTVLGAMNNMDQYIPGKASEIENQSNNPIPPESEGIFDLTLGTSKNGLQADPNQWHAFTVPFPVNALTGIYNAENDAEHLINEVDYAIMDYHGDVRAEGNYGWKKFRGTLVPGTFYIMTVNGDITTFRFKKAEGAQVEAGRSKDLFEYPSTTGDNDNGWNGVGNPSLYDGLVGYNILVLDPYSYTYVPLTAGNYKMVVGMPFFIQADADGTMTMQDLPTQNLVAARKQAVKKVEQVAVRFGNEEYIDRLYISANEDALDKYETGKDLMKMTMTNKPTVAQITGVAYSTNLCMVNAPLRNNQANYSLMLYAPTDGEYTISVPDAVDADIYLTYDNQIIWNIAAGPYNCELKAGNDNHYGLILRAKAPEVVTGVENAGSLINANGVQKVFINDQLYILKGEKLYDVTGKMVK